MPGPAVMRGGGLKGCFGGRIGRFTVAFINTSLIYLAGLCVLNLSKDWAVAVTEFANKRLYFKVRYVKQVHIVFLFRSH